MISKNKQSRLAGFRILLAIPTAFALLLLFSFTSMDKTTTLLKNNLLPTVQTSLNNLQNLQQKPVKKTIKFTPPIIAKDGIEVLTTKILDTYYLGGHTAWWNFINKNYKFTKENRMKAAEGEVLVQFKVSENGEIKNPKIIMGLRNELDKEAINVFSAMPKWKPLIKAGKLISVIYQAPLFIKVDPVAHSTQLSLKPIVQNINAEEKPLVRVNKNPEFKGGYEAMQKFLSEKIHYPETAKTAGVQGIVFVQFVVTKTGTITNVKILRGIGTGCDEEAIRVVKAMPDWTPGENDGKAVPVKFQIPVKFQLGKSSNNVKTKPETVKAKTIIDKNGDKVFIVVEQDPKFPGGFPGMQTFLRDKIQYPTLAQRSGIQGTVFVQFVVTKTGELSNIKILRGIGGGCDEEAVRVVKEMPKWIPGRQNGEAVSVKFQIPVKFQLAMK